MGYEEDPRVVLTLDAGGTKFVFSAAQGGREVGRAGHAALERRRPAAVPGDDRRGLHEGEGEGARRRRWRSASPSPAPPTTRTGSSAASATCPAFSGGVALGPMLEDRFGIPVFINNDGDLFAFGEAIAGLPAVGERAPRRGRAAPSASATSSAPRFGTGFGGGIVQDGRLWIGDNSAGGEIWLLRNKLDPKSNIEEAVSHPRDAARVRARGRHRVRRRAGAEGHVRDRPGREAGPREAAIEAFRRMGEAAGDALASAITLVDGLVVIGGGLTGAAALPARARGRDERDLRDAVGLVLAHGGEGVQPRGPGRARGVRQGRGERGRRCRAPAARSRTTR